MAKAGALAKVSDSDLLTRIARGDLLIDIAKDLGVSHDAVGQRLRKSIPQDYKAARTVGITVNLHKSRKAITEAKERGDALALAGAREEFRADAWFAEREAPELYGQRQYVQPASPVVVNIDLSHDQSRVTMGVTHDGRNEKLVNNQEDT